MRIDYIIAGIAALIGAGYLLATTAIPRLMIGDQLGPKAFPTLIGLCLLGSAALLVFETLKAARANRPEEIALPPFDRRLLVVGAAIVFLLLSFESLGYLLSVGVFLLVLTMYLNRGHWIANAAVSVGFAVISDYVFNLLEVRLPPGVLGI